MRWLRFSIVPALAALAAVFALLPNTGADLTIRMIDGGPGIIRFLPSDAHVQVGDRVAFVNETERSRRASCVGCQPSQDWTTGLIQPGQTISMTFRSDAAFEYGEPNSPPEAHALLEVGEPAPPISPSASPSPAESPA